MNLNEFYMYLFCWKKGGGALCMYMYGNASSAFTTEPLDGCVRNLVGMKYS